MFAGETLQSPKSTDLQKGGGKLGLNISVIGGIQNWRERERGATVTVLPPSIIASLLTFFFLRLRRWNLPDLKCSFLSYSRHYLPFQGSGSQDDSRTRTQHNDARRGEEEALRAGQVSRSIPHEAEFNVNIHTIHNLVL